MSDQQKKVGVFIDYENIHISLIKNSEVELDPGKMDVFRDVASQYGEIRKVVPVAGWDQFMTHHRALIEFGYEPKQTLAQTKNASDILFTVECMQNLYEERIDVFVLFAGDGGYLPLVNHLLNCNKEVYMYSVKGSSSSSYARLGNKHVYIQDVLASYLRRPGTINPLLLEVAKTLHFGNINNKKYTNLARGVLFKYILSNENTYADIKTSEAAGDLIDQAIAAKLIYTDSLADGMRVMKVNYDNPLVKALGITAEQS